MVAKAPKQTSPLNTASTRVRDNQRRSRARQREYIEDLKKRLQEFRSRRIEADVELQAAARKVVHENTLLRALLRQYGVTSVEIEDKLHGTHDESEVAVDSPLLLDLPTRQSPRPGTSSIFPDSGWRDARQMVEGFQHDRARQHASTDTEQVLSAASKPRSQGERSISKIPMLLAEYDSPEFLTSGTVTDTSSSYNVDNEAEALHPPGPDSERVRVDDATSCEKAASIIASMRGHEDTEEARAELGCLSYADCMVKNTTIFRVMDQ